MIADFRKEYFFLSNFYMRPMMFEEILYPSSEHAFQAAKSFDVEVRKKIAALVKASHSKAEGRNIALRDDWEKPGITGTLPVKYDVMKDVVRAKFTQHKDLAERLLATGDQELVEGNNWNDITWGVCGGVGTNWLGKILMEIREELRAGTK
jgi:ribA/ribD-fused uncharacterized protein